MRANWFGLGLGLGLANPNPHPHPHPHPHPNPNLTLTPTLPLPLPLTEHPPGRPAAEGAHAAGLAPCSLVTLGYLATVP